MHRHQYYGVGYDPNPTFYPTYGRQDTTAALPPAMLYNILFPANVGGTYQASAPPADASTTMPLWQKVALGVGIATVIGGILYVTSKR